MADAALGVVDSVDLISPSNDEGAVFLYHRLLSCGLRLAATAGTDTFLSFSHSGTFSNPPGWGRVYAYLGKEELSLEAFKRAVRAGRTLVTNGPWLTLDVNGQGPGTVLDLPPDDRLAVRASVRGLGAERVSLVGPDGVMAEGDSASKPDTRELPVGGSQGMHRGVGEMDGAHAVKVGSRTPGNRGGVSLGTQADVRIPMITTFRGATSE